MMSHPPKKAKAGPKLNVVDKQGNKVDISSFDLVGLYFSAHWCPPCKAFTPVLAKQYQKWKKKDESIEIVFISSDGDEASANNYYTAMPWARLVYDQSVIDELGTRYGVEGIPNIQIWNGDLSKKMTNDARSDIDAKKAAAIIDWKHMLESGGQCNEFEEENSKVMTPMPANPKYGRVRLIQDPKAFQNSFVRFSGDNLNGWSEAKQLRVGQEGTVTQIYGDKTITMVFNDGAEFDFPFETVEAQLDEKKFMEIQMGKARLLSDPEEYKNSFVRFDGDDLNGWSEAKQLRVGQEGTVTQIYEDKTVTIIFDDGAQFDLPFETVETQDLAI